MKMKKMLAILAALSVLGTTGLTVGAEDTATTTEPATEAITTTETEAETTAAETTAETETTVETDVTEETAATEENQVVGKIGETAEFTFNGIKFQAVEVDPRDDPDPTAIYVTLKINRIEADGSIVETNLSGIDLFILGDGGDGSHTGGNKDVLEFLSIDGDILTIDAYGGNQSYQYVDGQFVPAGTAPTTTTTTAAETTTTTTTTTTGTKGEVVTGDFVLDGVTLTPKIEYKGQMGDEDAGLLLNIYSSDGTLLLSLRVELPSGGSGRPEDYDKVSRYLVKTGSNTITVIDYTGSTVKYHSYVFENGKFVSTGTTTDDNQEKTFTVEIPYAYFTVINSITGEVITTPGANKSMVNAAVTSCTNGNVASLNYGNEVSNDLGAFLQSITVSDVKPGTLTIKGTCESYSFLSPELVAAGYTTLPHAGDAIGHYFTLTVTIDENGNIVTGGSDNGDSGKTDNGSASNAPATKNTSGTPKTGDITTVPAVAVGLTLTAAGVVAFISKRKK